MKCAGGPISEKRVPTRERAERRRFAYVPEILVSRQFWSWSIIDTAATPDSRGSGLRPAAALDWRHALRVRAEAAEPQGRSAEILGEGSEPAHLARVGVTVLPS